MAKKQKQNKLTEVQAKEILWYSFSVERTFKKLKTNKNGLTAEEAVKRLKQGAPNKLPEEKPLSWLFILLNQFKSPLVFILIIAAVVSLVLKEFIDMGIISAAVIINTIVGFIQEFKANRAISHLKKLVQRKAKVLRDEVEIEVDVSQLVLGDIILIEAGDRIPADGRLLEAMNLQLVEAALTGESLPSKKSSRQLKEGAALADRENIVFMGTSVMNGRGKAVVCATGKMTELGKIATLVKQTEDEKTPLQDKLAYFSKMLGIIVLAICFLIFILGFTRGRPPFEMFETAVAVAVAAIPEGLLVSVTVVLAIGMQRILKKKALVRKLIAAETLGSTTVICSDKTGTLTEGKMQVTKLIAGLGELCGENDGVKAGEKSQAKTHELVLKIGLLCNNAAVENPKDKLKDWSVLGMPTEVALLLAAIHAGLNLDDIQKHLPRLDELPFDSEKKFMATLHRVVKKEYFMAVKGAPEEILARSAFVDTDHGAKELTPALKKKIKENFEKMTRQGLRVLAVGYKSINQENKKTKNQNKSEKQKDKGKILADEMVKDITFVGLVALKDPLRAEAKEAIGLCKSAGIRPVIITGDHRLTAQAVACEIGIPARSKNILTGKELDSLNDKELKKAVAFVDIFARVSPHHKLRIIDALQDRGEVVAMTGDGVNDAPAIKAADIGLALGSGTDVAKGAADMVLLDDNYKTIVSAVEQGRIIFDNIKKIILYLLCGGFSEMILITGALILGLPLPLTAAQILWINLVTDGFPNIALTVEPGEKDIMDEPPRKKERIFDTEMKVLIFIIGIITDLLLFGIYFYLLGRTADLVHIQTMIFAALGTSSLFYVFSCKSIRHSIFSTKIFSNMWLIVAVISALGLQVIAIYLPFFQKILGTIPLNTEDWILVVLVGVINILAIEFGKWIFIVRRRHHKRELT
ncbi:HAD-IC family P-type ATPase [Patescibacteria group bacterium]|nr:HAD-IC family P-type ATPase [Patescibacteria group bacterium]MBU4512639.1 HAD-IC family P-type ATPase [Patescibacteria group bacterium]MCG2693545.1 HAD-IC family P-type ATPase [Candidatus Parcubacteria bacterium]